MKKIIIFLFFCANPILQAQTIISWTEENGVLGLGYPVPIPVDTTEAFDGFRTYNGLFTKHQSMALNNPYITGHIVGQTRQERDIWAYVLSDNNDLTKYGVKEGAMFINGNIHAREWQTPEILTGIIELLNENSEDQSLHQFLLENTTIITVPVNNVDGLLQTQRYPKQNWYANNRPRDGRMRRKNMLNVDENLFSQADHLNGVDLNRNNSPYWATSGDSSSVVSSIVHHGAFAHSEPETSARLNAANLVDSEQLRIYTDVHSFSQVHYSVRTNNFVRNTLQTKLLRNFTRHHAAFPARKNYIDMPSNANLGIGTTTEYFANVYEIPSWTLEIEPSNGGGDYGGFGNNFHDGFILPESEITRVREQMAQTFMVAWYEQAGPPSITQFRIVEKETNTIVYDAQWDIQDDTSRQLFENKIDNLIAGEQYSLIVSFDKPMRVRDDNNQIVHSQGQNLFSLDPSITANINGGPVNLDFANGRWLNQKSTDLFSYQFYKDDSYAIDFTIPQQTTITDDSTLAWSIDVADMVGQKLDSNPNTVVTWANGQWQNYENSSAVAGITGGIDNNYSTTLGTLTMHSFVPATQPTGLYYDPSRDGEGFSYELLVDGQIWLQWFTYDGQGNQRWYSALGRYNANRIIIDDLSETSGGVFGSEFDSENISLNSFGTLEIIFSGGEALNPAIGFHEVSRKAKVLFTDLNGKKLRTDLHQLSLVKGAVNNTEIINTFAPIPEPLGLMTGSWYDPLRSGEGYVIEILEEGPAIVFWYTYDLDGNHMWLFDSSGVVTTNGNDITLDFNNVMVANGGKFGDEFNPDDVNLSPWGALHFELDCTGSGNVNYQSSIAGFGNGQYDVVKLTNPLVLPYVCDE